MEHANWLGEMAGRKGGVRSGLNGRRGCSPVQTTGRIFQVKLLAFVSVSLTTYNNLKLIQILCANTFRTDRVNCSRTKRWCLLTLLAVTSGKG